MLHWAEWSLHRSPALVNFFSTLFKSLLGGYLAGITIYTLAMLLITRLGRKTLLPEDRVSRLYTLLLAMTWFTASLAGTYICCIFSLLPPYGTVGLPIMLAFFFAGVMLRNARQLRGQQSGVATFIMLLMIALGTATALHLNHALPSVS